MLRYAKFGILEHTLFTCLSLNGYRVRLTGSLRCQAVHRLTAVVFCSPAHHPVAGVGASPVMVLDLL